MFAEYAHFRTVSRIFDKKGGLSRPREKGRLRGLNLVYLTGVVCVCVFACDAGVGVGLARLPPALHFMEAKHQDIVPRHIGGQGCGSRSDVLFRPQITDTVGCRVKLRFSF
jgi:hypothetical protein